jgi:hypothetical protein
LEASESQFLIEVCLNGRGEQRPSCLKSGSHQLFRLLKKSLSSQHLVKACSCKGYCHLGPIVKLSHPHSKNSKIVTNANLTKIQETLKTI